jgi:hypothetical protein
MHDHDEDNDGKFPDESPVEVRYPRSKQEKQGDREQWPWLPGTIVERCGPVRSDRAAPVDFQDQRRSLLYVAADRRLLAGAG